MAYIDDIKHKNGEGEISANEIVKKLKSVDDELSDAIGYEFSDGEFENMKKILNAVDLDEYSVENIRSEAPILINTVAVLLSQYSLYGAIALDILLIAAIIIINNKNAFRSAVALGAVFVLCGILSVGIFAAAKIVLGLVPTHLTQLLDVLTPLTDVFLGAFGGIGLMSIIVGSVAIVASILIRRVGSRANR